MADCETGRSPNESCGSICGRWPSIDTLATYVDHCLSNGFPKGGQVLQDIVNELGRRLEYDVTNGRYQGTTNAVGFDGIWRDPSGYGLVVEVKTTDAYWLSLDTVAGYRDQLLAQGVLARPCSILIVVGRTDTGELEAQVRGSRHAWDIRLISVDALLNLVRIKESADSQETIAKIRRLLTHLEYTRLDDLVDVVFTTTQDVETAVSAETGKPLESESQEQSESSESAWEFTPSEVIQGIRERIVAALAHHLECSFVKKSRALYWDPSRRQRMVCTVSKRYANQSLVKYWYAYHLQWHAFLQEGENGFFVLGCTDLDVAFSLPVAIIREHLEEFHTTRKTLQGTIITSRSLTRARKSTPFSYHALDGRFCWTRTSSNLTSQGLTLMRTPIVKRQTSPKSGFCAFFLRRRASGVVVLWQRVLT
jgi:hypothetical protein